MADNNDIQDIEDPYMGFDDDGPYLGAGENSLFGGYLDDTVLDPAIDPALSDPPAAQARDSGSTVEPAPDATSILPEVLTVHSSSQNTGLHEEGTAAPDFFTLPEGEGLYPPQPLQDRPSTGPLALYGLGPQQVQDSSHLAAGGQGQVNIPPPNNNVPSGMLPALPSGTHQAMQPGMQPSMPQQFVPQGQAYIIPNVGYPVLNPMQQHMAMPMQDYPIAPEPGPYPPIGKKIAHNRRLKHGPDNDPLRFYHKPFPFGSWGPLIGHKQPHPLFQYSKSSAELKPAAEFTKEQLITFLLGAGHPNLNRRHLTLWVQNTPAQSNDRYVNGSSSGKCRYKNCKGGSHTILKGWFRVAFDEHSHQSGRFLDPFHNAGYMHLHCFETLFDLGYLIHHGAAALGFSIRPDTRDFIHEARNPASITRDHSEMIDAYNDWVKGQQARADHLYRQNLRRLNGYYYTGLEPEEILPHADRLGAALTNKHLSLEVRGRSANRDRRGGVNIGMHRGDLDEYNRLKFRVALRKRQNMQSGEDADNDEAGSGDAEQCQGQGTRSCSPQHGTKRKRGSRTPSSRHSSGGEEGPNTKSARHGDSINAASPGGGGVDYNHDTAYEDIDTWFNDDDDIYDATPRTSPVRDLPQAPPQQIGPRTRKRSRETGETIVDMLTSQHHLTRSAAHQAQSQLEEVPQHVQDQVLAAVPEYAASLLIPAGYEYNDDLEQRLVRLSKRQRREVDQFVQKQEERDDKRKPQSF
ncbi:hypothetical protein MMYC01_207848 [Madurella mycetomatis]|uniref:Uncharacterized protein n=1 Tax=Madurella mycetomatis TaxID=100816 RepID=A0A175W1N6_9PEZI|nr:hypothetical protein MMYC01_207848 [Madurella mycetomatis]